MTVLIVIVSSLAAMLLLYRAVLRPRHLRWGATDQELALSLPGDDLVKKPNFNATRGISIAAPPSDVWKWIIQIGSGRAGWYSIDLIDNGGRKSASEILPQFQKIAPGQFIPFTPDQKNGMWVKEFREPEYILWTDRDGNASWLWYLYETSEGISRLLTRLRTRYIWKRFWILYYLVFDIGDIIMMRRCLKGIRQRAEKPGSTGNNS